MDNQDLLKLALLLGGGVLGFALWRLVLWKAFAATGFRPLVIAYLFFLAGLLAAAMVSGSVIFGFAFFFGVVDVAIFAISLFGVPVGAFLIRIDRLGFLPMAGAVALAPLVAAGLIAVLDPDRFSFRDQSYQLFLFVLPATAAFFVGLMVASGRGQVQHGIAGPRPEDSARGG